MGHWHSVRQGEALPGIAERYGFKDWHAIYDHAKNASFRQKRPDPFVLAPGDQLFVPNLEQRYEQCATEQVHRFQLKRQMAQIRLVVEAEDGTVFGGRRYQLKVGDLLFEGVTAGDGLLEASVPSIADAGELTLWLDDAQVLTWHLAIGHLDPVDTVAGATARLKNLGYDVEETRDLLDERAAAALKRFQKEAGLEVSGELDDATRQALLTAHGS